MTKKIISWVLVFLMIFTVQQLAFFTAKAATPISDAAGLAAFRDAVNAGTTGGDYILTADIDLSGYPTWAPIGDADIHSFTGTFDGQGHTISNMTVNKGDDFAGLFGVIVNATISNVGIVSGSVHGTFYVGAIVGRANGASTISNCYNKVSVSGNGELGGIVGRNYGTVQNCYNTGSVTNGGGIAGESHGLITNCYNAGTVTNGSGIANINDAGTISYCVSISQSVSAKRVLGEFRSGTLLNNYAWDAMTYDNSGSPGTTTLNGADITKSAIYDATSWLSAGTAWFNDATAGAVWTFGSHALPGIGGTNAISLTTFSWLLPPPTISTLSPTDNASNVNVNDNLVVTFSHAVIVGTGNIVIKKSSDDSVIETIDVTGGKVTGGTTATITINPDATLSGGTGYYVQIDATAFDDTAGNSFAGIADTTTWNFTTADTTAPTINTLSPADNAVGVGVNDNLVITFSESVVVGTGNIVIKKSSDDSVIETIDVTGVKVTGEGTPTITINPATTLSGGTGYYVQIDATAFDDTVGNSFAGIADTTTWNFTIADITAPTINTLSPADNAVGVGVNDNLVITFSESVVVGTGNIVIKKSSDDSVIETIDVTGAKVTGGATNTITINPDATLSGGTEYYVQIDATAFDDTAGNSYAGMADTTSWSFTTIPPATITSGTLASNNTYIDIDFSEGIYGANDAATALDASDLALTFTQNGGTATNVVIGSIKQNDSTVEGTASALAGGETTVRVFLTITGTPNGNEMIEIKPADASSIYNAAGCAMLATQTTGVKFLNNSQTAYIPPAGGTTQQDNTDNGDNNANVIIDGDTHTAGTVETSNEEGRTTTTVTINAQLLEAVLLEAGEGANVLIPIPEGSDHSSAVLNGQIVSDMEELSAILVVNSGLSTYTLPASEINIDAIAEQLGVNIDLSDIEVSITISTPENNIAEIVANASAEGGFSIVVPAVEFTIECSYNGRTVTIDAFNSYVDRTIEIPDGVDPSKITTAIVVDADGTVRHVPTEVLLIDGVYYAVIHSMTNSVYTLIYNEVEFGDTTGHWAAEAIDDMASRLIINGYGNGSFVPEGDITRAEFAAIVVRALGLSESMGSNIFTDVTEDDWFCGYVATAAEYGIISGYGNGTFGPQNNITCQQAMTMIARAMAITNLAYSFEDGEEEALLAGYADASNADEWAKESIAACLKTGIVQDSDDYSLYFNQFITRAETAVLIRNLLINSKLIQNSQFQKDSL